jgi:hypothetical protein
MMASIFFMVAAVGEVFRASGVPSSDVPFSAQDRDIRFYLSLREEILLCS